MELVLTFCTVIGGIAALWFFWDKQKSSSDKLFEEMVAKLDQIGVGLDSEKNVRAIKYLTEQGFGNEHYNEFLMWAFGNLEKAVIAAYCAKTFDELCENNNIVIDLKNDNEGREVYLQATSDVSKFDSFWNGSSYFNFKPNETFGVYYKTKKIGINQTALKDFQTLHKLFISYVNNDFKTELEIGLISPEGIVPCNY